MDFSLEKKENNASRSLTLTMSNGKTIKAGQWASVKKGKWEKARIDWSEARLVSAAVALEFAEAVKYIVEAMEVWAYPAGTPLDKSGK